MHPPADLSAWGNSAGWMPAESPVVKELPRLLEIGARIQRGDTMIIQGHYPPCPSCKGVMNNAASSSGAEIHYIWENHIWTAGGK